MIPSVRATQPACSSLPRVLGKLLGICMMGCENLEGDLDVMLQRLSDRDTEASVILRRVSLLVNKSSAVVETSRSSGRFVDANSSGFQARDGTDASDSDGHNRSVADIPSSVKPHPLSHTSKVEDRKALQAHLARIFRSQKQAEIILDQALAAQSAKSQSNTCAEASRLLLSTPSLRNDRSSALDRAHRPRSSSMRPLRSGPAAVEGRGSTGSRVTYRAFLERLTRQESKGFVRAIRLFLFSILGNGGDVNPIGARPRASADRRGGLDTEDVEVYGSSFLVQRCAEFFLAMQNAIGVHPSWAELGYDSIVACREHLERFVLTKIHPLAFRRKMNGAVDASISARLRTLQFLTADDLNVNFHARDEATLMLAQGELRKMGRGRCPGDVILRVVRCCDILFATLDQGRRFKPRVEGDKGPAWQPGLDPAGTADNFLPVLIYVVLRANVPRLHSMCEYVQAFHSPVALMSRPGYCFIALRSAVEFLMTLNGAAVGMPEEEFTRRTLGAADATKGLAASDRIAVETR